MGIIDCLPRVFRVVIKELTSSHPTHVPSLQMKTTKRMATEVRSSDFDLAKGNTVNGVKTHISRACEKGRCLSRGQQLPRFLALAVLWER
jgi:hypothetical protein